jgi:hypothetical protein
LVESATLTAVTVTTLGLGTVAGAVYKPVAEIVPTVALPPATLFTAQVTALLKLPVPCTTAANCCVWPTTTLTILGVTVTDVIADGVPPSPPPLLQPKMLRKLRRQ